MDGDGTLNHKEDIYRTAGDLVHGIYIGKYPRALYSRIYAVLEQQPTRERELAFLEWMAADGQQYLPASGLMALVSGERQSVIQHIRDARTVVASVPVSTAANKVFLLVCTALLVLSAIVIATINLMARKSPDTEFPLKVRPSIRENSNTFPGGLFFDRSHTWAFMERDGKVRIGIDDFLLHVIGPVTRVEMRKPGEQIRKGEPLVKLIQRGKQLVIKSPLSGVVAAQNEALAGDSNRINSAPYAEGWVYLVEPRNWLTELKSFVMGEKYSEWIRAEFSRLKDFFSSGFSRVAGGTPTPVIQDGGEIQCGILEDFGPEVWEEFQTRFINPS
jgi:glycine cleavage system H lipoate-binding protein